MIYRFREYAAAGGLMSYLRVLSCDTVSAA
jgi:hypothetical protein